MPGRFDRHGVDADLVRRTLSAARQGAAEQADLFVLERAQQTLMFEDGQARALKMAVELGAGVRVWRGDRCGHSFSEDLRAESLAQAARMAAGVSRTAEPGQASTVPPWAGPGPPGQGDEGWEGADDLTFEDQLPLLRHLAARLAAADLGITALTMGIHSELRTTLYADSEGRLVEDFQPTTDLWLTCTAERHGRRETGRYNITSGTRPAFSGEDWSARVVRELVRRVRVRFSAGPPPRGELPVVMAAGASGILLHEAIGHGLEADFNRNGRSPYAGRLCQPVARPIVSIVDDGAMGRWPHGSGCDDEGIPAGRTTLVEGGMLAGYLHDRRSAAQLGVTATGNGRRQNHRHLPLPRMWATYMAPGPHGHDEIVRSVRNGIYLSEFGRGYVDVGRGDFRFNATEGYLIEAGVLTRPLKGIEVVGNGPEVLERIDMVGDDLIMDAGGWACVKLGQSVPVRQGMPTVRVGALRVGPIG
jgi:TldD protein